MVIYDQKIELLDIKKVANGLLIKEKEKKALTIFGTDPGNFQGSDILKKSKFEWYNGILKKE